MTGLRYDIRRTKRRSCLISQTIQVDTLTPLTPNSRGAVVNFWSLTVPSGCSFATHPQCKSLRSLLAPLNHGHWKILPTTSLGSCPRFHVRLREIRYSERGKNVERQKAWRGAKSRGYVRWSGCGGRAPIGSELLRKVLTRDVSLP